MNLKNLGIAIGFAGMLAGIFPEIVPVQNATYVLAIGIFLTLNN